MTRLREVIPRHGSHLTITSEDVAESEDVEGKTKT